MLFSVLIPVYNTSKYLKKCVESVLSQSEGDFEIVLVDDGSTDNSGDMCDVYAQKYPEKVRVIHKENEGLMMTRRRGFKEAKGDYFICLDSDDYLCDYDALKKIKKMIVEKGCDLVIYNYLLEKETRDKDKEIILFDLPDGYIFEGEEKQVLYKKLLVGSGFNAIWIKAAKRKIVDVDVDYSVWKDSLYKSQGEDLFQSMPILDNAQKIGYVNSTLYFYRWNGGSISRNCHLEFYYAYRTIFERELEYFKKWSFTNEQISEKKLSSFNNVISILIHCYNNYEDKKKCFDFFDCVSEDPFFYILTDFDNKKNILLYYRLVSFCIKHRMHIATAILIKTVTKISSIKHRK